MKQKIIDQGLELNRRRKILRISYDEILNSLYNLLDYEQVVQRKQLPTGYLIIGVWNNYERGCFDFVIAHPSFEIVPEGMEAPKWDDAILLVKTYKVEPLSKE